ncbi:MAG: glycosyltransferase [Mucilaginibacter sp.]|nr:glycosyltransferase [Mucilaginibacter sp.]
MNLPDLNQYRLTFEKKGISYPLSTVPAVKQGLISVLPDVGANKTGWPWTEETDPLIYDSLKNWPKITIVTPSFNQGEFIEETIRSVLLQNYPNLEYIIIDGGSTDGTRDILVKYSPWVSHWQSEKDEGQGQAINLGFSLASGDYYAWINSDDYYLKNIFSTVTGQFLKNHSCFIYGYGFNYNKNQNSFELIKVLPFLDFFIKIPSLVQPSTFWRASIHKPIWEELYCSLDFELWLRLVKGNKRHLIKAPLSVANVHDKAKTSDPKMKAKWHEDHLKIWSEEAHGRVYEWKRINFLNRLRIKLYILFKLI